MFSSNAVSSDPAPRSAKIRIRDCRVRREGRLVLEVAALDLPAGQVTALIGPNGAGKSTLLGVLQLIVPAEARPGPPMLTLDGPGGPVDMARNPLAMRRRMAAAFQDALLLTMSVRKNLETALRLHGVPRAQRRARSQRWLDRFGVGHLAERSARELSGGEAQRVSLARAFALDPEVLLLDEPFGALDAPTRAALIDDFHAIVRETGATTLLVTHDRDEALRLADRIVVLIDGRVRQAGTPGEVFGAPADAGVAAFVGVENVWPVTLARAADGLATYRLAGGAELDVAAEDPAPTGLYCIRPEEITIATANGAAAGTVSARNRLAATVRRIEPAGPLVRLHLTLDPGSGGAPARPQGTRRTSNTAPVRPQPVEGRADSAPFVLREREGRVGQSGSESLRIVAALTRPSLEALALDVGSRVLLTFKATAAHVIPHD